MWHIGSNLRVKVICTPMKMHLHCHPQQHGKNSSAVTLVHTGECHWHVTAQTGLKKPPVFINILHISPTSSTQFPQENLLSSWILFSPWLLSVHMKIGKDVFLVLKQRRHIRKLYFLSLNIREYFISEFWSDNVLMKCTPNSPLGFSLY